MNTLKSWLNDWIDIENISNKMCVRNQDNPDMTLNPNQNFLKNFLIS